jgi:hypothetical protein
MCHPNIHYDNIHPCNRSQLHYVCHSKFEYSLQYTLFKHVSTASNMSLSIISTAWIYMILNWRTSRYWKFTKRTSSFSLISTGSLSYVPHCNVTHYPSTFSYVHKFFGFHSRLFCVRSTLTVTVYFTLHPFRTPDKIRQFQSPNITFFKLHKHIYINNIWTNNDNS